MNILYCGDKNIEDGLLISILSLIKNIKQKLCIYVLTIDLHNEMYEINPISPKSIDYLDQLVKNEKEESFVKRIDITELFKKEIPLINFETRFTPCCMLRLFADKISELPDKLLYLDTDIICRKDFTDLYNQNIDNFEVSGVLDYYGKWFFKRKLFKFDYLNSGVLMLNLEKIRKTGLFTNCRNMCQSKKMFMPDQSAINKLAMAKKICPRKYNEQRRLQKNTVIQHFTTSFRLFPWLHTITIKPWQIDEVHEKLKIHEYDDILEKYKENVQKMRNKEHERKVETII